MADPRITFVLRDESGGPRTAAQSPPSTPAAPPAPPRTELPPPAIVPPPLPRAAASVTPAGFTPQAAPDSPTYPTAGDVAPPPIAIAAGAAVPAPEPPARTADDRTADSGPDSGAQRRDSADTPARSGAPAVDAAQVERALAALPTAIDHAGRIVAGQFSSAADAAADAIGGSITAAADALPDGINQTFQRFLDDLEAVLAEVTSRTMDGDISGVAPAMAAGDAGPQPPPLPGEKRPEIPTMAVATPSTGPAAVVQPPVAGGVDTLDPQRTDRSSLARLGMIRREVRAAEQSDLFDDRERQQLGRDYRRAADEFRQRPQPPASPRAADVSTPPMQTPASGAAPAPPPMARVVAQAVEPPPTAATATTSEPTPPSPSPVPRAAAFITPASQLASRVGGPTAGVASAVGNVAAAHAEGTAIGAAASAAGTASPALASLAAAAGPAAAAIVGIGLAAGAAGKAIDSLVGAINQRVEDVAPYSADVAAAQANVQVREIERNIDRGQEMGAELARFIEAEDELSAEVRELKDKLVAPMLRALLPFIEAVGGGVESINNFFGSDVGRVLKSAVADPIVIGLQSTFEPNVIKAARLVISWLARMEHDDADKQNAGFWEKFDKLEMGLVAAPGIGDELIGDNEQMKAVEAPEFATGPGAPPLGVGFGGGWK